MKNENSTIIKKNENGVVKLKETENINNKKENYQLIDIFKFIGAIFVVMIHTNIMSDVNNNIQWYVMNVILRIAVPFFFIASGFLFGKKYLENKNKLKDCLYRLYFGH